MAVDWAIARVVEKEMPTRKFMQLTALLRQNRQQLLGKLAVAHVQARDLVLAEKFSKQLQNSGTTTMSAQAIQTIGIAIVRAVASRDPAMKNCLDLQTRIKAATSALKLLQHAISICAPKCLSESMEIVRSTDMLVRMLYKTEFGDDAVDTSWSAPSTLDAQMTYCPVSSSRYFLF